MRKGPPHFARAGFASFALAALLGCSSGPAPRPSGVATPAEPLVVRRGPFVRRVLLTGELAAVRAEQIVVPRTSEWQVQIRWMESDGAEGAAGAKILEFDHGPFASSLEQGRLTAHTARTELLQQEAQGEATLADRAIEVERRRTALDKARIDAEVPVELLSRRDWEERQLARERAGVELEKANADLAAARRGCEADLAVRRLAAEKAERAVATAEEAIAHLTVAAPRAGVIQVADHPWEGRKLQVGDTVWVGLPVMRIPDLGEMRVDARLADVDDGAIAVGNPAVCTLDAYPDRPFRGTVVEIAPVAQEAARTALCRFFRVVVALAATDAKVMRPGMSVKVEVEAERVENAIVAPRAGLDLSGDRPLARLAGGATRAVRVGPCGGLECVIEAGLAEGERLEPGGESR